ncbi:MAG: hypothetical protein AAFX09_09250 [Pseudomonadota bacterium]
MGHGVIEMGNKGRGPFGTPGEHFAKKLTILVDHFGIDVERQLLELLGRDRLKAFYSGEEPRLGELEEIAHIFGVPVSTFLNYERGDDTELTLALIDIARMASTLPDAVKQRMVDALLSFVEKDMHDSADLPRTMTRALRRASEV